MYDDLWDEVAERIRVIRFYELEDLLNSKESVEARLEKVGLEKPTELSRKIAIHVVLDILESLRRYSIKDLYSHAERLKNA